MITYETFVLIVLAMVALWVLASAATLLWSLFVWVISFLVSVFEDDRPNRGRRP